MVIPIPLRIVWILLSNPMILLVSWLGLMVMLTIWGRVPLRYNLRNLSVRWLTTLLTATGFVLVIGLLTVMLAFVNGMYVLTQSTGEPGNVLVISEGFQDESISNLPNDTVADVMLQRGILRDESTDPPKVLASAETYMIVVQPIENEVSGRAAGRRFLPVRGVDDVDIAARVHNMELIEGGRWLSQQGVTGGGGQEDALEAVIGVGMASELGSTRTAAEKASASNKDRLDVGDSFMLGERKFQVVGVMASTGSAFDSEIWAKRSIVGPMFGKDTYSSVICRTAGPKEAREFKAFLNSEDYAKNVQAFVETEYFANMQETGRQFLVAIIVFAAVMSIGGLFGVMNTMFATVAQRSRDIGVLRMLGFSRGEVLASFLVESLCLALIGGAIGCFLGTYANGVTVKSIVGGGAGGGKMVTLDMVVSDDIIVIGLVVALTIGAIGGLLPALSAMLVKPLYSLR